MKIQQIEQGVRDAMGDPEFSREIRYFTGTLKLSIGDDAVVAEFDDGRLVEVAPRELADAEATIVVAGSQDHWDQMCQEFPVPFFQCLQTTAIKHGLRLSDSFPTFAYLPALNRLVALLRAENIRSVA